MAKVMVVEDDHDIRETLGDWLSREHEVCLVAGVPEALARFGDERPDVVVTDLELPPHRGDELLATIAARDPGVVRILHTGAPCRALGESWSVAHRVLKKGCDLRELSRVIREFLQNRTSP